MDHRISDEAKVRTYIDNHPAAVLGTINEDGTPQGAVVYVCALQKNMVCFITKNQTQKYMNLVDRPAVSLTIIDEENSSTLQANGQASVITDPQQIDIAMEKINRVHAMKLEWLPPIAKLRAGHYALIGVHLDHARLAEYGGRSIGDEAIFTEI